MTNIERMTRAGVGALQSSPANPARETIVFLHGWSGSKEQWWHALSELGTDYPCVALDLPGTGESVLPDTSRTMSDMAKWVKSACEGLGAQRITLVGHSLGGNLAAQTALDYPELVKRLVLVDAALETNHLPRRVAWTLSPRYGLAALRLMRASALPMALAGRRVPHGHVGSPLATYARRMHLYIANNQDHVLQHQLTVLMGNSLDASHLSRLTVPLLLVHGRRDHIVPVARAVHLAKVLPNASLRIFPRAFHCPMDTDPHGFAAALRAFVTENP